MDAPKCRLCGKGHWGNCGPKDLPDIQASPNTAETPKPSPNAPMTRNQRWRQSHPDEYRAYQRDYMRRRRAQ